MRNISEIFLSDLKEGVLSPFLRMVKFDTSLCLELRGNSVNVYYRGGNLMKVKVSRPVGTYSVSFNPKYFKYGNEVRLPSSDVANIFDTNKWLAMAPTLKQAMDQHLSRAKKRCSANISKIQTTCCGTTTSDRAPRESKVHRHLARSMQTIIYAILNIKADREGLI